MRKAPTPEKNEGSLLPTWDGWHTPGRRITRTFRTGLGLLGLLLTGGLGCSSVSLCDQDGDGLCPPTEDCDDSVPGAWCETPEAVSATPAPSATPTVADPSPTSASTPTPTQTPEPCAWYPDSDGDGFGDADATPSCEAREGWVQDHSDCDDANAEWHPGATEFCDAADNDCDGEADETQTIPPKGQPKDLNMLNTAVTQPVLLASLGILLSTPLLQVEGCDECSTWYQDTDGDGYGNPGEPIEVCSGPIPENVSEYPLDCNDLDATIFPGAYDILGDGVDGNCNGTVDIITTLAGTGQSGSSGDGGASTAATVAYPQGVATDALGNVYIADTGNHKIRKIATDGVISTFAGTGVAGYAGDGGLATSATLNQPTTVWVDHAGVAFVADTFNYRIRAIGTTGTISTVAGNGTGGFSGDGGSATSASINMVYGVTGDVAGNLYLTEYNGHRVRKVSLSPSGSRTITTIAGTGTSGYSGDGGAALSAQLMGPEGITLDSEGRVVIADTGNNRVRRIALDGTIRTIAGTGVGGFSGDGGPATAAQLIYPYGLVFDALGNLFIADRYNGRVRKVDEAGIISTVVGNGSFTGSGDGGSATQAGLGMLTGLGLGPDGVLYIPIFSESKVRKVTP